MKFTKAARPAIMGQNGMVSSGHHLASLTGVEILKEGGNAVDAALAAAFVMSVVKPETSGPGGDLFALVYMRKTGKVEALNSSGPAPAKASIEHFHERGLKAISTIRAAQHRRARRRRRLARTAQELWHKRFSAFNCRRGAYRARGLSDLSGIWRERRRVCAGIFLGR